MFFAKRLKAASAVKHKVALSLDFNKKTGEFLRQKNVKRVGNEMLSTFGFTSKGCTLGISRALFTKNRLLIALTTTKGLYSFNLKVAYRCLLYEAQECVISHVVYQDTPVLSCTLGTYYTPEGLSLKQIGADYFPSMAVCYDRIFGVNGYKLSMTNAGDITTWDDKLQINAHTPLDAVVAMDKLYVLGDTCYTLTPNAEEINMKFAPFASGIGTVQPESVVTMEKKAIFASNYGLYELKSSSVTPIFPELSEYVSFENSVACLYKGKYFITCKRKDGDTSCNDVLLVLDIDSRQIYAVLDVKASHISVIDGVFYAVMDNELFYADDVKVESCYNQTVDFGNSRIKYLDRLTVRSASDVDVWISNGTENRRYRIKGKRWLQSVPLAGSGRQFDVKVQSSEGLQLDTVELSARSYEV